MGQAIAYNPCFSCNRKELCHLCELEMHRTGSISTPKWISVEERLPEQSGKYLVCTKNGNVYQTKFYSYPENVGGHWGQKDRGRGITHWMPLPAPPKGEKK